MNIFGCTRLGTNSRRTFLIGLVVVLAACDVVEAGRIRGRRCCRRTHVVCAKPVAPAPDTSAAVDQAVIESQRKETLELQRKAAIESQRMAALEKAVLEYAKHTRTWDWRAREEIDRRLFKDAGELSAERLNDYLRKRPHSLEVGTAVAVCLGGGTREDSAETVADMLGELLASVWERVRYRAAEAITQRLRDGTMPEGAIPLVKPSLERAAVSERNPLIIESMTNARNLIEQQPH